MEKYQESRDAALKHLKLADHMLTITFPVVNDTKLLLAIMENVFTSLSNSMGALLYFEQMQKRVPKCGNSFDSKYNMFVMKCVQMHNIDESYLKLMNEIKDTIARHEKSPIEFVRKDRFVICGDDYLIKTITADTLRDYISSAKKFFTLVDGVISQ